MSPIGPPHSAILADLMDWSIRVLPQGAASVRPQCPVEIPGLESEPVPDLVWSRPRDYRVNHPRPEDIFLVVEIADSSLAKHRGLKARLHAEAGITDYWIVNANNESIEVRRDPHGPAYRSAEVFRAGQEVRPLAFPDVALPVDRVFPG
jgi:Uma2 family endonuclease